MLKFQKVSFVSLALSQSRRSKQLHRVGPLGALGLLLASQVRPGSGSGGLTQDPGLQSDWGNRHV